MPASGSVVRSPGAADGAADGGALGRRVGSALGVTVGAGHICASGGRESVRAEALPPNGLSELRPTTRITTRPTTRITPAMPPKINICRRRRCGPSATGGGGGGGGGSGGTPGAVTVPEPHAPPGRGQVAGGGVLSDIT